MSKDDLTTAGSIAGTAADSIRRDVTGDVTGGMHADMNEESCGSAPEQDRPEQVPPAPIFAGTLPAARQQALAPGLYLVATPIGNLEDITLRALRVLTQADQIACEDTRQTQKLLNHYSIATPTVSSHAHNEAERSGELLALLKEGGRVAVVSDAGMPGIADPGMYLARAAIEAGIAIYPVPGANAALSALIASGLTTEAFAFRGFLPEKAGARRTELERLARETTEPATLIFYEAPHRILETLGEIDAVWSGRARVVVARELTKLHEEFLRGTAASIREELAARDRVRGEIVLLIEALPLADPGAAAQLTVGQRVAELVATEKLDEKDALKRVARERGLGKSEAYRELQRERGRAPAVRLVSLRDGKSQP